jgi:hypothetical protein
MQRGESFIRSYWIELRRRLSGGVGVRRSDGDYGRRRRGIGGNRGNVLIRMMHEGKKMDRNKSADNNL